MQQQKKYWRDRINGMLAINASCADITEDILLVGNKGTCALIANCVAP
jgi:hypothetical protein